MFDLGFQELIVIFLVALIVFGPNKLPELGRTLGKWITEIKRGVYSARIQMENEFHDLEKKPLSDSEKPENRPETDVLSDVAAPEQKESK